MENAFDWIKDNGLPLEADYEYKGVDMKCKSFESAVKISGFNFVPKHDPAQLMAALNQQPIGIGIHAGLRLQFYRKGIFDPYLCGKGMNHGVLAVGYGHDNKHKKDYWIVKNSWGAKWGDKGYFRILKTDKKDAGKCGMLQDSTYPIA